jgi:hypothetical protein
LEEEVKELGEEHNSLLLTICISIHLHNPKAGGMNNWEPVSKNGILWENFYNNQTKLRPKMQSKTPNLKKEKKKKEKTESQEKKY